VFPANEGWDLLLGLMLAVSVEGQPAEPEVLPPPRLVAPPPRVRNIEVYYGPDPYWRMRMYAWDRYGNLRARVIYAPEGAYYLHNGEPYPHTPTKGIP
jgi:hypothetical protein